MKEKPYPFERVYHVAVYRAIKRKFRTQKAFATALGIRQEPISRILWNIEKITEEQAKTWIELLQVPIEKLSPIIQK